MSTTRDYQRTAVYRSETVFRRMLERGGCVEVAGTSVTLPPQARFGDIAAVQRYVDAALAHPGVVAEFGDRGPVSVRVRKGDTAAHYEHGRAVIAVPDRDAFLHETIIIHELGHHFAPKHGHGPAFTATFVRLLDLIIGPEAGFVMNILYRESDVDVR